MLCIEKITVMIKRDTNIKDALKEMHALSVCAKLPVSADFNGVELKVSETTDLERLAKEYEIAVLDHDSYCS